MENMTRRDFLKLAGMAIATASLGGLISGCGTEKAAASPALSGNTSTGAAQGVMSGEKAKVYFTKHIDADHLIQLYKLVNGGIEGKTAIKLHTGEPHGPNILPRNMVRSFMESVPDSTIIEANTAYGGGRDTTAHHRETLKTNGWTFSKVDLIDEEGSVDFPVHNGHHLKKVAVGSHLPGYDSLVVLTHFKGHTMGGFGGSLKNIAIGCASGNKGKLQVHGVEDYGRWVTGKLFMELMADSGHAICDHFGKHMAFLNVMRRMSVDCDCAGTSAAEPTIGDIGMLASTDILAIDQASVDLVYNSKDPGKKDLIERIESREGLRQLSAMKELGMGNEVYELISID